MADEPSNRIPKQRKRREIVADLAKSLGRPPFHIGNVQHWKDAGAPINDPEKLLAWYRERHPERATNGHTNGAAKTYAALQEEHLHVKIARDRLRLEREHGKLADMDSVNRTMVAWINDARTLLEAVPESACMFIPDPQQKAMLRTEWTQLINNVLMLLASGADAVRDRHVQNTDS